MDVRPRSWRAEYAGARGRDPARAAGPAGRAALARAGPARSAESAARARAAFGDRVVWHVNATAHGGGVAEMLQTLLAYGGARGSTNRWLVLDGDPEFFAITKRLHNMLHGDAGDGGALGDAERAHYEAGARARTSPRCCRAGRTSATSCCCTTRRRPGWSTACARRACGSPGAATSGGTSPTTSTDAAWAFLRPYLEHADAFVFSRRVYAPDWVDRRPAGRDPAVDRPVLGQEPRARPGRPSARSWPRSGWSSGAEPDGPVQFERRDGSPGTRARTTRGLIVDGPPPPARRPPRRAGEPVGPAQGHGRRDGGLRPDGRRRSRTTPT